MKNNKTPKSDEEYYAERLKVPTPKEIVEHLDKHVIGQERAKKTLAVAIYNHYKRVVSNLYGASPNDELDDVMIEKSNILLTGHTGTGKTYMVKTIAKAMGIPCYIADATKLTESGYVGDDVESIVVGLLQECDYNVELAQIGIICADEIDKIGRKSDNPSITRDVSGEGVQQSLLKIVEGSVVGVPPNGGRKHPEQKLIYVDTTNILFIGMGAFDGLDKIVERRLNTKTVGFNSAAANDNEDTHSNPLAEVMSEDLRRFGLIPELIGRFPVVTYTDDLSKEDLVRILVEPQNSLTKQYRKLFLIDGVDLEFDEEALDAIAEKALELKIGARGLRSIMEKTLTDVMFESFEPEMYGKTVTITREMVENASSKDAKKAA